MKLKKKHKNDSKKSDLKVESCCKLQLFDTPGSAPPVSLSKELGSKEGTRLRQQTIHFNAISQLSQYLSDSFRFFQHAERLWMLGDAGKMLRGGIASRKMRLQLKAPFPNLTAVTSG